MATNIKILGLVIITVFATLFNAKLALSKNDDNIIYLNFTRREVCSNRAKKCWPVALGNKNNPTPFIENPVHVLSIRRQGFTWINPFTGVKYAPGNHDLGSIWIQYTTYKGVDIGFHETPNKNVDIRNQQSLGGCIRMNKKDIIEFSKYVKYLDKIYAIRNEAPIIY